MNWDLLEHILYVSRRMAQTRALTPLLNYVVDEAIKLVGAERGYVVLISHNDELVFKANRTRDGKTIDKAQDQVSTSIIKDVIADSQPLVLDNALDTPRFNKFESVIFLQLRSVMCVPLVARGNTIGAIYVENRSIQGQFSTKDLSPLILFANQAAVAIENTQLIEGLENRVAVRTQELEEAMLQVEKSWTEAIEANRLRTVWMSKITHDLKAPLSIAAGALSLLEEGALGTLEPEQEEWISKSLKTVVHVTDLINHLFDLSSIEAGGILLEREIINLQEFLQSVYDIGQGLPWSETVELKLAIPDTLPNLSLDPVRIRQVLLNLISNAHKFTSNGSVTMYARLLNERQEILLGVVDTGEGIATDRLDQLFERFQQFDKNLERRRQGAGLGLAICHEFVDLHGGRIWVENNFGGGANFMFTLPVKTVPKNNTPISAN